MKFLNLAAAATSFRRNSFKNRSNCLYPKSCFRNGVVLFIFYFSLLPSVNATFAQRPKDDSLTVGSAAPTFFLRTLNGSEFYLSDYCGKLREPWKNEKPAVVILSFFATWCEPCLKEIAALEIVAAKFAGQNLRIFLINVNEKPKLVTLFIEKHQIKLPVLRDSYGLVAQKYGADKLPRYVLINKDGKITLLGKGYAADFKEKLSENLIMLSGKTSEVRLAQ